MLIIIWLQIAILFVIYFHHSIKINKMGETNQAFSQALAKIDATTNAVAEEVLRINDTLEALKKKVEDAGLTATEEAAILADLNLAAERAEKAAESLKAIGKEEPADEDEDADPETDETA